MPAVRRGYQFVLACAMFLAAAIGGGLAPLSVLRATPVDDAPPISAGVRSPGCAGLRLAPRISVPARCFSAARGSPGLRTSRHLLDQPALRAGPLLTQVLRSFRRSYLR